MARPNLRQRARHEPLFDIHPRTNASIAVFYSDRTLETFGSGGAVGFGGLVGAVFRQTGPAYWSDFSYELRSKRGRIGTR